MANDVFTFFSQSRDQPTQDNDIPLEMPTSDQLLPALHLPNYGLILAQQSLPKFRLFLHQGSASLTSIATLVSVEGHRWPIEDSFETVKKEF
jgi:hypothetical protein